MRALACAALILCVCSLPTQAAENFGDWVARCLAGKGVAPNTSAFDGAVSACEKEVRSDELANAWVRCLIRDISAIDDGVSPASDIATAVQFSCQAEQAAMSRIAGSGYEDKQKVTCEVAMRIVLELRAARNNSRKSNSK